MNKVKTRKSASRRFRITPNGKVLRRVASGRHLRRNKSATQKRRYAKPTSVTGAMAKRVKRLMAQA